MGSRATRVHDPLRNTFVIEVGDLLPEDKIFQQSRAAWPRLQRVLIVIDRGALVGGKCSPRPFSLFRSRSSALSFCPLAREHQTRPPCFSAPFVHCFPLSFRGVSLSFRSFPALQLPVPSLLPFLPQRGAAAREVRALQDEFSRPAGRVIEMSSSSSSTCRGLLLNLCFQRLGFASRSDQLPVHMIFGFGLNHAFGRHNLGGVWFARHQRISMVLTRDCRHAGRRFALGLLIRIES